jgi:hypothetical protein
MNRTALATLVAAVALAGSPARAAVQPPPAPDPARGRVELKQDRRELADDRWDLARIEQLLARFDAARARRDRRALASAEAGVLRFLDRELWEARAEVVRASWEIRRDAWRDPRDGRAWGDDRRDWRDDRRDLARVRTIRAEFGSLRGRMERRALDRKHALVAELAGMARAELREDRAERREGRREARADPRW